MKAAWKGLLIVLVGSVVSPSLAHAGGHWAIGVNFGFPVYYRPWCGYGYYGYPYYRPYPVYVEPAPIYVAPPIYQPVAVPAPAPAALPAQPTAVQPSSVQPASASTSHPADGRQTAISRHLSDLASSDENIRADSALELGRMRASKAVDPLTARLAGDSSPVVREAAARALGLIGSPKGLPGLERAAQKDGDRDVRNSARFAIDVIQSGR